MRRGLFEERLKLYRFHQDNQQVKYVSLTVLADE
jgi:hypothetical protein